MKQPDIELLDATPVVKAEGEATSRRRRSAPVRNLDLGFAALSF
jgi:hypothetical protein